MQTLVGTDGPDTLTAGTDDTLIIGGLGADTLTGGPGNDTIYGGVGTVNERTIDYAIGDALFHPDVGGNALAGGAGDDTLVAGGPNDHLDGGAGNDHLYGIASGDVLSGGDGNDTLQAYATLDVFQHSFPGQTLVGGTGDDRLIASAGNDTLLGGPGNDTFELDPDGSAVVDGGDGYNTAIFAYTTYLNLKSGVEYSGDHSITGNGRFQQDQISSIQHVIITYGAGTVIGSDGADWIQAGTTFYPTSISGGAGDDRLEGGTGNDTISGGDGNDILSGGPGANVLDGGAGTDTALFAATGAMDSYSVTSDGTVHVVGQETTTASPFGVLPVDDTLTSVENLQFVDGTLTFDPASAAAQVYRMYEAAFGRAPDPLGFDYWTHQIQNGESLHDFTLAAYGSAEFQADTTGFSDKQYIDYLYGTVLHRAPDPGGEASLIGDLSAGQSRADLLQAFSESPENQAGTARAIAHGLWVETPAAAEVTRIYDAALDRLPDPVGLSGWVNAVQGGLSLHDLATDFLNSPEFQAKSGGLDDRGFVDLLYRTTLHRAPDGGGEAFYVAQLQHGLSHADLLGTFSESPEHQAYVQPYIDHGVVFTG